MKAHNISLFLVFFILTLLAFSTACQKKTAAQSGSLRPSAPSEPEPQEPKATMDLEAAEIDIISKQLNPVFFDFNKSDIRQDQIEVLRSNIQVLEQRKSMLVLTIEGHCDERGTEEYNLALGERRADSVKGYLVKLGLDGSRIVTISYGKSKPFALGHDETSWQLNRRGQSVVMKQ